MSRRKARKKTASATASASSEGGSGKSSNRIIEYDPINRLVPASEAVITYSATNEPVFSYSLAHVLDKGFNPEKWTSSRLKYECLYFETADNQRYELSADNLALNAPNLTFTLCKVNEPFNMFGKDVTCPLVDKDKSVVAENLSWSMFKWGSDFVIVGNPPASTTIKQLDTLWWQRFSGVIYQEKQD